MPWKSPLVGYENAEPLPTTVNPDGKSLYNPPGPKSLAYDEFPEPIDSSNNGFDFHSERIRAYMSFTSNLITYSLSLLHAGRSRANKVC